MTDESSTPPHPPAESFRGAQPEQPADREAAETPQPPAPRRMRIAGIHHVTLISADLHRTTGFYRDVLGLALWREAANDDDPGARHFWFSADGQGSPGTILSFLEYPQMGAGSQGTGTTHHIALAVDSPDEIGAWRDYLRSRDIPTTEVFDRGGLVSIYLRDPDGHILEIVSGGA